MCTRLVQIMMAAIPVLVILAGSVLDSHALVGGMQEWEMVVSGTPPTFWTGPLV